MSPVSVRYIADDVESATAFYRDNLGFTVEMSPAPGFAMLARGGKQILLDDRSGNPIELLQPG
jgi:catechol 2,3-dioxygenase-like lactoylglutathione lyase family enzyme